MKKIWAIYGPHIYIYIYILDCTRGLRPRLCSKVILQMCIFKRNVFEFDFVMFLIVFRSREEKFERGLYGVGKSIWILGKSMCAGLDWSFINSIDSFGFIFGTPHSFQQSQTNHRNVVPPLDL